MPKIHQPNVPVTVESEPDGTYTIRGLLLRDIKNIQLLADRLGGPTKEGSVLDTTNVLHDACYDHLGDDSVRKSDKRLRGAYFIDVHGRQITEGYPG